MSRRWTDVLLNPDVLNICPPCNFIFTSAAIKLELCCRGFDQFLQKNLQRRVGKNENPSGNPGRRLLHTRPDGPSHPVRRCATCERRPAAEEFCTADAGEEGPEPTHNGGTTPNTPPHPTHTPPVRRRFSFQPEELVLEE